MVKLALLSTTHAKLIGISAAHIKKLEGVYSNISTPIHLLHAVLIK
jgi:hypothetical protein